MSQIVHTKEAAETNNANAAAMSSPKEINISDLVFKCASVKIKALSKDENGNPVSTTREKFSLNREKLINAVRSMWKSIRSEEKHEAVLRVPEEIDVVIISECEKFIEATLKQVNPCNAMSLSRKVVPNFRSDSMEEVVTAKGKNILTLKEQKLFVSVAIREQEARIRKLELGVQYTADQIAAAKEKLAKLRKMELWINATLEEANKALQQ